MSEPVVGKVLTVQEMMETVKKKGEEAKKKFEENGGMCLNCGKNPGDKNPNTIDPFACEECNKEVQEILSQLPGVRAFKIPI